MGQYAPPPLRKPLKLAPGEKHTVSFPIAVRYRNKTGSEPLFPTPGKYTFRCQFVDNQKLPNAPPGKTTQFIATAVVTVEVSTPGPDDEPWTTALKREPALAVSLLNPSAYCSAEHMEIFRKLIEKAPESTYVNYGRLAIARHHLLGLYYPNPPYSPRVHRAFAVDIFDESTRRAKDAGFPFNPHVYIHLMDNDDTERQPYYRATLDKEYRTALEWINEDETLTPSHPGMGPGPAPRKRP